jgi:hypothetical protein
MSKNRERTAGRMGQYRRSFVNATRLLFTSLNDFDFLPQVRGEDAAIFLLQILPLPIFSGDNSPAFGRAALTLEGVVVVIGCRPIMSELLPGQDVPQRDKHNLPLNRNIWFTRVIAENHATFSFFWMHRADKEIVRDLDFRGAQDRRDLVQGCAGEDVPTLDAYDLTGIEVRARKQASTVDCASTDDDFRREIR